MSFDLNGKNMVIFSAVISIPLEQGNVFRQSIKKNLKIEIISIPLEQGNVFRRQNGKTIPPQVNFNPFGTGQCLSTVRKDSKIPIS